MVEEAKKITLATCDLFLVSNEDGFTSFTIIRDEEPDRVQTYEFTNDDIHTLSDELKKSLQVNEIDYEEE